MIGFVLRRLLAAIPVIFLASIPVFLVIHLAEGDPVLMLLGVEAPTETIEAMRERLGLNLPLWQQYGRWVGGIVTGDFGRSVMSDFTVSELLASRIPATLSLAIVAMAMAIAISFPLGIYTALQRGRWFDRFVSVLTSVAISIPHFWLGILLVLLFAVKLNWLPAGGYAPFTESPWRFAQLVFLPAFTLSLYLAAILTRFVRTSMAEVLTEDYIRTARSKGVPGRLIVTRHAVRNALIPVVTALGVHFGRLLSGTIIVEVIFAWPGLGQLMLGAINNRDFPVVQATFLVFIVLVIVSNLVTDILYSIIDPRIRLHEARR